MKRWREEEMKRWREEKGKGKWVESKSACPPTATNYFINPSGEPFCLTLTKTFLQILKIVWCFEFVYAALALFNRPNSNKSGFLVFDIGLGMRGSDLCPSSAYFWLIWCVDLFQAHTNKHQKQYPRQVQELKITPTFGPLLAASSVAYVVASLQTQTPNSSAIMPSTTSMSLQC